MSYDARRLLYSLLLEKSMKTSYGLLIGFAALALAAFVFGSHEYNRGYRNGRAWQAAGETNERGQCSFKCCGMCECAYPNCGLKNFKRSQEN